MFSTFFTFLELSRVYLLGQHYCKAVKVQTFSISITLTQ